MTLDPSDLNPTDVAILDELREGRASPAYIAEKHGYSSGNARNRMTHLASHDHVEDLGGGLYKLIDDPRADTANTAGDVNVLADDVEVQQERIEGLMDEISEALDCLERGLDQAPDDVSGRMAFEDARSILEGVSEDE